MRLNRLAGWVLALSAPVVFADEVIFDAVSVTATKMETPVEAVPHAVAVVDADALEEKGVRNINDAIKDVPGVIAISKNGGYDSRLIIRGAGLKARYGVREIMVIRDGVPVTDPDSFTRFDFVDIDDMGSVEIFKGPGSIEAANAIGGVIHIRSQSVFDNRSDRIKVGAGSFNSYRAHVRKTFDVGEDDMVAVTASHRRSDNDWREWNKFDTSQFSLKHGHFFKDDSTLETELSYTEANLQLPASLNDKGFDYYLDTGKTRNTPDDTGSPFVKSGRYSKIGFLNSRYEKKMGAFTVAPRVYVNWWEHYHPVTGAVLDKANHVLGLDVPVSRSNRLFGKDGKLVFGATVRRDQTEHSERYKYADYTTTTGWGGTVQIAEVLSDRRGALIERSDSTATLAGLYAQQQLQLTPKTRVDFGARFDRVSFETSGYQWERYDYAARNYVAGIGAYSYSADYDLFSPKLGVLHRLSDTLSLYANVSRAQQAPTDNEVSANFAAGVDVNLKASTATQYEIGTRWRQNGLQLSAAAYFIALEDEIVKRSLDSGATYYENAGRTEKKGLELSASYQLTPLWRIGGSWEGLDYRYVDYVSGGTDYSGKVVRFTPEQRWTLFVHFEKGPWRARLSGRGMDAYYMDDENTEKYPGYNMVSDLMVAWQQKQHRVQLNVHNLFDLRYAEEASKVWYSSRYAASYYTPGEPRNIQLTYSYRF